MNHDGNEDDGLEKARKRETRQNTHKYETRRETRRMLNAGGKQEREWGEAVISCSGASQLVVVLLISVLSCVVADVVGKEYVSR